MARKPTACRSCGALVDCTECGCCAECCVCQGGFTDDTPAETEIDDYGADPTDYDEDLADGFDFDDDD